MSKKDERRTETERLSRVLGWLPVGPETCGHPIGAIFVMSGEEEGVRLISP
jgi:hypothetical protein